MDLIKIKFITCTVNQFYIVKKCLSEPYANRFIDLFNIISENFSCTYTALPAVCVCKSQNSSALPVIYTFKLSAAAYRPVDRIGSYAEFLFQLFHQLIRISGFAVHLVDKGKYRNMPHGADSEKLPRLRFYTLGSIQHHNSRIRCHQCTVSILRKILMARCIQNIDAVSFIFKLQNRTGNGYSALLLKIHPVRNSMPAGSFSFNGTGCLDCSSIQQQFFCECGFSCVRVRDDGKSPPSPYLFLK